MTEEQLVTTTYEDAGALKVSVEDGRVALDLGLDERIKEELGIEAQTILMEPGEAIILADQLVTASFKAMTELLDE